MQWTDPSTHICMLGLVHCSIFELKVSARGLAENLGANTSLEFNHLAVQTKFSTIGPGGGYWFVVGLLRSFNPHMMFLHVIDFF
jgi:hypothetical protein